MNHPQPARTLATVTVRPLSGSAVRGATPRSRARNFGRNRTVSLDPATSTTTSGPEMPQNPKRPGTYPLPAHRRTLVSGTPTPNSSVPSPIAIR